MVWTSIATGKRPYKHGIHGFTEPSRDGMIPRPISSLGRDTKAAWNILPFQRPGSTRAHAAGHGVALLARS